MEYIGNFAVLSEFFDLPSVGEELKNGIVISVETTFPREHIDMFDQYIFFIVKVTERESIQLYDDFEMDTKKILYAVKKPSRRL